MANTTLLLPSAELVKKWQQEYTTQAGVVQNSVQETALAYYEHTVREYTARVNRYFTTHVAWQNYTLSYPGSCLYKSSNKSGSDITVQSVTDAYRPAILTAQSSLAQLLVQAVCPFSQILHIPAYSQVTLDLSCSGYLLSADTLHFEYLTLHIGHNAQVTLLYTNTLATNTGLVQLLEIFVGAYASVTAVFDYELDSTACALTTARWHLDEHARVAVTHGLTGGAVSFVHADYALQKEYAQVDHVSLYALSHNNQAMFSTQQHHSAPYTTSSLQIKQVVRDRARVRYQGLIALTEQARESQAEQQHAALLIGQLSRACAVPALEISTKQVQCRHASGIGAVIPEYIWALQMRGFEHEQAQELIIQGFLCNTQVGAQNADSLDSVVRQRIVTYK